MTATVSAVSFVPVTGPATFRPSTPAREGVVEFTGERRTVPMPMRGALPVLTKSHTRDDLHPSVALLSAAALLGLRLVAAGKLAPTPDGSGWQAVVDGEDTERIRLLAQARQYDDVDAAHAEQLVRGVLDAVADCVPRSAPTPGRAARLMPAATHRPVLEPRPASPRTGSAQSRDFAARLQARIARHRSEDGRPADQLPSLVSISLRVEADEEDLAAGSVRLVLQVHDEANPLHLCDAALLWTGTAAEHGFGERARTHAAIALRGAAQAWPVLDRLQELAVPDQITLDGDEIASLLEEGVQALKERGVDVLWPRSLGRDLTASAVLERRPAPAGGGGGKREDLLNTGLFGPDAMFAFEWRVALHGDPLTDAEMEELAAAAAPVLKLRGAWTVVHPSVAKRARKRLLRKASAAEALAATLSGVTHVGTGEDRVETQVIVGASLMRLREQVVGVGQGDLVPVPDRLRAELRDYQRRGLTWLADLTALGLGGCLADDMGLGKTITLIALHLHRQQHGAAGPTLVVCPASLLGNWEAEVERFAPGTPVRRFHGSARDLTGLDAAGDPGFVLTTYGTMRRSAAALAEVGWDLVVADEAQHVKNAASATARMLRTIPSAARVALTGTPVENDLTELWAILDWCVPGLLGSRLAFRRAWAAPIEAGVDTEKTKAFAELIGPFLLRRRKSDPGIAPELPPKTETDHLLTLTREQTVLYEAFVRDTMERIERADEDSRRGLVLMLLTGLKQICNHPAQFLKQQAGRIAGRSQKIDVLDELLETILAEEGAVLVFTQYVAMARLLEAHWTAAGVPHQFLHGGTPVREREAMVARFQAGPEHGGPPVFLLSLKAGGTGLNLTRADHVVHVDRWWNPAVEEQATDRAYRIGQTRPVQVHRLVTRGTIETRIAELLTRKRALSDAVLGRGEAALTELSNAELRDLVALHPVEPDED